MPHDRQKERQEIIEVLEAGQSISMLAPRRIGKTWLMKEVAKDLKKKGWNVVLIDVEGLSTDTQLLQKLCREIESSIDLKRRVLVQLSQRFKQIAGGQEQGSLIEAASNVDPRDFLETLIESLNAEEHKTAILIDEIALFVLEHARLDESSTRALLYHLRNLQQKFPKVRWFLTGSVGLDIVAQRYELGGALLEYYTYPLKPFDQDQARSFCNSYEAQPILSRRFDFGEGAFEYLSEQVGWLSPYYLKLVLDRVTATPAPSRGGAGKTANPADIEAGIAKLLGYEFRNHFSPWREHLRKNFPAEDTKILIAILNILSANADGEIDSTILSACTANEVQVTQRQLKDFLFALQSDGFLVADESRWRFRSGLLRRYWLEYEV
jgi:uncharacterized protein